MLKVSNPSSSERSRLVKDQLVTVEDLQVLKEELLAGIRVLLQSQLAVPPKKWLKSYEVKQLLKISTGTLQNLRANGSLPFTKMGGLLYYDTDLINGLLSGTTNGKQAIKETAPFSKK